MIRLPNVMIMYIFIQDKPSLNQGIIIIIHSKTRQNKTRQDNLYLESGQIQQKTLAGTAVFRL